MRGKFEDLEVWQESQNLAVMIYGAVKKFPADEKFGLVDQLRRASSSVSANIAEGYGRDGRADTQHFLAIAVGSLLETKSFLYLANRLGYIDEQELDTCIAQVEKCHKLLRGFRNWLKNYPEEN